MHGHDMRCRQLHAQRAAARSALKVPHCRLGQMGGLSCERACAAPHMSVALVRADRVGVQQWLGGPAHLPPASRW